MPTREEKIARLNQLKQLAALKEERSKRDAQPSKSESFRRGLGQGLSFGFIDEATGALGATIDVTQAALGQRGDISFGDAFRTRRDVQRRRDAEAAEVEPKSFGAGQVGGSIATSFVPGGAALNVGKGAKIGTVLAKGAAAGGIVGAGTSQADLTRGEAPQFLLDTAGGAAIGAGTGAVFQGAGAATQKLAKKARDKAGSFAFKAAVGNQQRFTDEAIAKKNLIETGRSLLKNNIVRFGDDAASIANRVEDSRKGVGKAFGEFLKDADKLKKGGVSGTKIGSAIRDLAEEKGQIVSNKGLNKRLIAEAKNFESRGDSIPFEKAQELKNLFKFKFGDPERMGLGQESTNRVNSIIGEAMDDAFEKISKSAGDSFKGMKSDYGAFRLAEIASKKLAGRDQKNQIFGLGEKMLAGGGIAAGEPIQALTIGIASRILKTRGNSAAAVALDKIGQTVQNSPNFFGKYAPTLQRAANLGAVPLAATHLLLSTDPAYNATLNGNDELAQANLDIIETVDNLDRFAAPSFGE